MLTLLILELILVIFKHMYNIAKIYKEIIKLTYLTHKQPKISVINN